MPEQIAAKPSSLLHRYRESRDVKGLLTLIRGSVQLRVQQEALRALAAVGTPDALEGIGEVVEAGPSELGELAIRALMRIPVGEAVVALSRGLSAGDPSWRLWVLKNLAQRPEPEAVVLVLDATRDPEARVRRAAAGFLELVALDRRRMEALDKATRAEVEEAVAKLLDARESLSARMERYREQGDVGKLEPLLEEGIAPPVRKRALRYLTEMGRAEALTLVGKVVAGRDREMAETALRLLSGRRGKEAVGAMAMGLQSWDPAFRRFVLQLLGARPEVEALRWVWEATRDPDGRIAAAARSLVRTLGQDGERLGSLDGQVIDAILPLLHPSQVRRFLGRGAPDALRLAAIRWLGGRKGEDVTALLVDCCLRGSELFRRAALDALESRETLAGRDLACLLSAPDPMVRQRTAALLARHAPQEAAEALKILLGDPEGGVRLAALRALAALDALGPETTSAVAALVTDGLAAVRREAVGFLARREEPAASAALTVAGGDPDEGVARAALYALAARQIWEPALAGRFVAVVRSEVERPRLSVQEADGLCAVLRLMGRAGGPEAREALVKAGRSLSVRIRRTAMEALQALPEALRREALAELQDTVDKDILRRVALELGEARDPRGMLPLMRAVEECGGRVGRRCLELLREHDVLQDLGFLLQAIRTRWPSVKKFAAREMEKLRSPEFVDPLLRVLDDEDLEVRMAAAQALRKFLDVERVARRLVEVIGYGDISLRQVVIEAIGEASLEGTRLAAAVDPLIRALGNRFLRKKAEVTLRRMGDRRGLLAIKRRKIRDEMIPRRRIPGQMGQSPGAENQGSQAPPRLRYD
jgi:HEAT repeat protein